MNTDQLNGQTLESILKRLRRIEGQLRGVQRMVEDGRPCDEVLNQMSASKKALDSASALLLEEFLTVCAQNLTKDKKQDPAQIADLVRRFAS